MMAARPIGSGTISFGLVSIPVKLFSTVDTTSSIHFNYLSKDGSRLKQQYIRASDGQVVERSEQVQGYEFSKGQYVIFTPEEIKAFNVVATNAIDITEFVPLESIERIYIEKVYYLGPDKGAARSYHLLKQALGTTGRAALANYAARGKSYLVLIRPMGDGLVMEQLKHEEELRPFNEVPLDHVDVKDAELDLAIKIIAQRTNDKFEPDKYTDEIRAKILAMIEEKVEGRAIAVPPEEKPEAKIIDLMEALRASVGEKREAAPRRPAKRAAKAAVGSPHRAVPAGPQSKATKTSKRSTS
jgi:DNA end-binding protein Ku